MVEQNNPAAARKVIQSHEDFGKNLRSAGKDRSAEMIQETKNKKNDFKALKQEIDQDLAVI